MILGKTILFAVLCIAWTTVCIRAFPNAQNAFRDSDEDRDFSRRLSRSLIEAFPNETIKNVLRSQSFGKKCLEGLGCFKNGPPFYHWLFRPVSLLPFDLKDMQTKFYLYTSRNERTLLEPNEESLAKAPYNKSLGLQIFVHGYLMKFTPEIRTMFEEGIEAIMKADRQNVVLVDWTTSNQEPYAQAVANGRVVGAQIAQLVNFLRNSTQLNPKKVHLIGHSLGGHVVGWGGKRIPKLGRISALDPAGPYFQFASPEIRLDHEDADFVDVIHTDAADYYVNGLGLTDAIGDIDFYPNGGANQPGCPKTVIDMKAPVSIIDGVAYSDAAILPTMCNHIRSLTYFRESITSEKCKFIGTTCSSYEKFKGGKCNKSKKAEMGFFARKDSKIPAGTCFYLTTSDKSPFCIPGK